MASKGCVPWNKGKRLRSPMYVRWKRTVDAYIRANILTRPATCPKCREMKLTHPHPTVLKRPINVKWACVDCEPLGRGRKAKRSDPVGASRSGDLHGGRA